METSGEPSNDPWTLLDRGFSLFPLHPRSKHPAIDWMPYQTARATPEQVAIWRGWSNTNTGVATGIVSGVVVLDCDTEIAYALAMAAGLPDTLVVRTPRGFHIYLQHPGWHVSNRAGRKWTIPLDGIGVDGWDLRGDGGFVVAPGSFYHPTVDEAAKGKVAGWYTIERDAPVAPAPGWLLALMAPPEATRPAAPAREAEQTSDYGRAALSDEIGRLIAAQHGEVNNQINLSAFAIAQLVAGGEIRSDEAIDALHEALAVLGVSDEAKATGTLERGWEAGLASPRAADAPVTPEQALGVRGPVNPLVSSVGADRPGPPPPPIEHLRAFTRGQTVWVESQAEFFADCYFVEALDRVYVRGRGLLTPTGFDTLFGGFQFPVDVEMSKKTRSAWDAFRQSPGWKCPIVADLCFRPECPPCSIVLIEGVPYLNSYEPIAVESLPGDASPFINHVRRLLPHGNDADLLLHWCASVVQNPGRKMFWWPVIQGAKGNGKSLIMTAVERAIGERYTHRVRADALVKTGNQFNEWIFGKLFLGFEEIKSSEGKRDFVEAMKDTITDRRIAVEGKGKAQRTADNRANGMMLTNHRDACPIDDDERRFAVFYTAQQTYADIVRDGMGGDYMPALYRWLDAGGYAVVTHFLRTMPLQAAFDPAQDLHRAPRTTSTAEAIGESLGLVEQEILEAIESGQPGFTGGVVTSLALRGLFDRLRKQIVPQRYARIMESLGYVRHPVYEPQRGRPNNPLPDGTKPVLYFRRGSSLLALVDPNDIKAGVQAAMTGMRPDMPGNVLPFPPRG